MKINILALVLSSILLSGCLTTGVEYHKNDPNHFSALRWNGGSVRVSGEKISETEYYIQAIGAGACSENQIMEEWIFVANQLAQGKKYSKETETIPYSYNSYGGGLLLMSRHNALKIVGKICIFQDGHTESASEISNCL